MSQELSAMLLKIRDRLVIIEGLVKDHPERTTPEVFTDLDRLDEIFDKYQDLLDQENT